MEEGRRFAGCRSSECRRLSDIVRRRVRTGRRGNERGSEPSGSSLSTGARPGAGGGARVAGTDQRWRAGSATRPGAEGGARVAGTDQRWRAGSRRLPRRRRVPMGLPSARRLPVKPVPQTTSDCETPVLLACSPLPWLHHHLTSRMLSFYALIRPLRPPLSRNANSMRTKSVCELCGVYVSVCVTCVCVCGVCV